MIRPSRPSDHNYVVDSWVGSFSESPLAASMRPGLFRTRWSALASHIFRTQHVAILADDDAPDVVLAWACHDGDGTLHYLFTRREFRQRGHARALVASIAPRVDTYTSRTTVWQQIAPRFARTWSYDPARQWFPQIIR
jgi:GNAT superfamily N-acetyltransferase